MSAILVLAAAFAAVIVVGCGAVHLHDVGERGSRHVANGGGERQLGPPSWRKQRVGAPQPAAGKIVWVRAGSNLSHRSAGTEGHVKAVRATGGHGKSGHEAAEKS